MRITSTIFWAVSVAIVLICTLLGYLTNRFILKPFDETRTIKLTIIGFVVGLVLFGVYYYMFYKKIENKKIVTTSRGLTYPKKESGLTPEQYIQSLNNY